MQVWDKQKKNNISNTKIRKQLYGSKYNYHFDQRIYCIVLSDYHFESGSHPITLNHVMNIELIFNPSWMETWIGQARPKQVTLLILKNKRLFKSFYVLDLIVHIFYQATLWSLSRLHNLTPEYCFPLKLL